MSRSVRDLRELVCVSRLTMREDEEDEDDLSRPMTSLSLFEESPSGGLTFQSPAHGYACPPEENHIVPVGAPQTVNDLVNSNNSSASLDTNMGLVKSKSCLPPVKSSKRPPLGYLESQSSERQGFYDDVLKHLEEETVRGWLQQANQSVTELSEWCHEGDNFVAFSHFWLAEFSLEEQLALVKLEISVLLDEIGFALQSAISARKIQEVDVKTLFSSLLPEYPTKLCSARGQYIFLNTLNTLSSGKTDGYKKLLTHVKLQTRLSSIAQRALSMRAYLVINLWKNVVQFYINIKNQTLSHAAQNDSRPQTPHSSHTDNDRIFQAVKRGNVRVLHYLLSNSFGSPNTKDSRGRSVALTSVLYNQPRVLKYLLAKVCYQFTKFSINLLVKSTRIESSFVTRNEVESF